MFFKFVKALKQDWISPWQVGMVGLCSVSALSLAQDSDLPRESGGEFSESCTHFRVLPTFQEAPHIAERYQQILAEISYQWYKKGSLMAWDIHDHFWRGVVWYRDSLWYPAILISYRKSKSDIQHIALLDNPPDRETMRLLLLLFLSSALALVSTSSLSRCCICTQLIALLFLLDLYIYK